MLWRNTLILITVLTRKAFSADVISSTVTTEFGTYVNPNPKNICEGDDLEVLTVCASEVLSKLDECKPDDLACECCALQSMKRDCYGLCPNTASGNFLAVLYDDCETMNDVNACNLPFKKHDAHVAKFLRPNARVPLEEKEPDFVIKSILENTTVSNNTNSSYFDYRLEVQEVYLSNSSNFTDGLNATGYLNGTIEENSSSFTANVSPIFLIQSLGLAMGFYFGALL